MISPEHKLPLERPGIETLVAREVDRAVERFSCWQHPFRRLNFSRARRILGQAHQDGTVTLSSIFLGTTALDDLRDTVRHELAHLIAGLSCRHDESWKRVAVELGALPRARGLVRSRQLQSKMDDAPYTLIAVMDGGEEVPLKPAFRRSPQYLHYSFSALGRQYFLRGRPVRAFRYRPRQD